MMEPPTQALYEKPGEAGGLWQDGLGLALDRASFNLGPSSQRRELEGRLPPCRGAKSSAVAVGLDSGRVKRCRLPCVSHLTSQPTSGRG